MTPSEQYPSVAAAGAPVMRQRQSDVVPRAKARLPLWIWLVTGGCMFWGSTTVNPALTVFAVATLPVMAQLLWRRGEPPLLAFACGMQWLQAAGVIFYLNYYSTTLLQAFGSSELETATWMSLIGVFSLAVGMWVGLLRSGRSREAELLNESLSANTQKLFIAYLFNFVLATGMSGIAFSIPALTQFLLAAATVKWVFVFMLAYSAINQRCGYGFLAICLLIEFTSGLLGYFATFKDVFLVLFVVALTPSRALHGTRLYLIAGIAALLLALGILWSAVKAEYREFLNQGYGQQEVLVPVEERFAELGRLVTDFEWSQAADGLDSILLRLSYVQYFALTLGNVPANMPFENGALWLGAIKHTLTPRMFFPDKGAINDSERTSLYTGLETAGVEQGTSIGIGYIAESYVDFGPMKMYAPIALLGVFFAWIYRVFLTRARNKLLGAGIASAILIFQADNIETSNIKIIGGTVGVLLVMSLFYRFSGRMVMHWLRDTPS